MTVEFTKDEFEAALPRHVITGAKLWYPVPDRTEYTYAVVVSEDRGVVILVTSSIRTGKGICDSTGDNSIRAWLADSTDYMPLQGKNCKPQRWVARTKSWKDNLTKVLRQLYVTGSWLGRCKICKLGVCKVYRSTATKTAGRLFASCNDPGCGWFHWFDNNGDIESE